MAAFDQDDYDEALQALEDHQRLDVAPAEWRLGYSRSDANTTKRSPFYAHNNFSTTTLINLY